MFEPPASAAEWEVIMTRKMRRKAVVTVISMALIFAALPMNLWKGQKVQAAEEDKKISMGISQVAAPSQGGETWEGDYVYYGNYRNTPIKWRVLDTTGNAGSSSAPGGLLLQVDKALDIRMPFEDGLDSTNKHQNGKIPNNQWGVSDIRTWLQGTGSAQFLSDSNFTSLEREGIMLTSKAAGESPLESLASVGLVNDTMFLLDVSDLSNGSYGYEYRNGSVDGSIGNYWWLRSAHSNTKYGDAVGSVLSDGYIYHNFTAESGGVVPAFNLDASKVLFLSAASGTKSTSLEPVALEQIKEWKLTLLDRNQSITVNGEISREDDVITIPYTYTGSGANQISVMIMGQDGPGDASGGDDDPSGDNGDYDDDWESDEDDEGDGDDLEGQIEFFSLKKEIAEGEANIKYYGKVSDEVEANGSIDFTLPEDFNEDGDTVYILTEQVNGANQTDYASQMVEVGIPAIHEHEFPDTWSYNDTEHWHRCIAPDCDGVDNEEREEHGLEEDEERSVPATCVADGLLWLACECGYSHSQFDFRADHIDEDGQMEMSLHDFADQDWEVTRKPTYTSEGEQRVQCILCKEWITEVIEPISQEHQFEEEILKVATCTEAGSKRLTCTEDFCEEVRIETIPPLGHSFGEWRQTVAATAQTEGASSRTCVVCGTVETKSIPKIVPLHSHDYHEDVWVSDEEFHWNQCDCGDTISMEKHQWNAGKVLKASTKEQKGEIRYTCTVCMKKANRVIATIGTKFSYGKYQYQVIKWNNNRPVVTTLGFAKGRSEKKVNMPKTVVFGGVTYTVRAVARNAFRDNKKITEIKINNKIEKIGDLAFFRAKNVTKITIGTGAQDLGDHTFCHLNQLKKMIVKSKKLKDLSVLGMFHGMTDFTIIVPKGKVSDYRDTVFFTHPQNVKSA